MRICLYGILADGCVIDHYISTVINFSLTKQVGGRNGGRRKECVRAHYFFSLTRHPLLNFINTPQVRLYSPLLHSTHDWRPNSSSYRIPILPLRHDTSAITTDCNRSGVALRCLLGLTFPDFDLAPKRNEKFGFTDLA